VSRLYLARHGSTSWTGARYCGRSDPPLDARGRSQASALADALAREHLDQPRVVSSTAERCHETGMVIAGRLGAELTLDERLREVDFGAAEGLTFDELDRRFPPIARALLAGETCLDWPGGERAADLARRAGDAWSDLVRAHATDVVVVAHAWVLRALLEVALREGDLNAVPTIGCGMAALLEWRPPSGRWRAAGFVPVAQRMERAAG